VITRDDALRLAARYLVDSRKRKPDDLFDLDPPPGTAPTLVPLPDDVLEKDYGWIIPLASAEYLRSSDPKYNVVGGIAALVVLKASGDIHPLGTAAPLARTIAQFERRLFPAGDEP
jgi:hypothetical protein